MHAVKLLHTKYSPSHFSQINSSFPDKNHLAITARHALITWAKSMPKTEKVATRKKIRLAEKNSPHGKNFASRKKIRLTEITFHDTKSRHSTFHDTKLLENYIQTK